MKILAGESHAAETIIALGHVLTHHQERTVGTIGTIHAIGQTMAADTMRTMGQVGGILALGAIGALVAAIALLAEHAIGATGTISETVTLIVYGVCLKLVFKRFQSCLKIF